jgi:hypothetical protein
MGGKNDRVKPVVRLPPMISTIRKLWSAIYPGCASFSTVQRDKDKTLSVIPLGLNESNLK